MKHPHRDIDRRVAVAGCKHTTKDLILGLKRLGYRVDHCITIDPVKGEDQHVAGYYDLRPFLAAENIGCTVAEKYSLKNDEDRERITSLKIDLLFVMGWQRLIPDWFLESLSIGAFGMHGSSKPLPHGRGRSPMNWSLIQGKHEFHTHLFRYMPGVDDGPIVGVQKFDITPFDTCLTLHFKNTLSMIKLCEVNLPSLLAGDYTRTPQPTEGATYYPKRSKEDGVIYWNDRTTDIYNLIRAVTHPFPGALSYLDDDPKQEILIWRAIPFDTQLTWPHAHPGDIVDLFYDGTFVVKTGDGTLLVQEYEGFTCSEEHVGCNLGHLNQPRKVWENLPD
ncbi:MAG: formyltransferase family protein [Planctomycetota bacterium]|nr:formyltransferase family protein [Planctomycetota bacterium]